MPKFHINDEDFHIYVRYEVEILLNQSAKSISEYGLPDLPRNLLLDLANWLIMEEKIYYRESLNNQRVELERSLNGKTLLWKAIITALRARGKIGLVVASSSVTSLLLPSCRIAHSRFKLPLVVSDESMCNIKKNTQMAKLIQSTDLIVEAPMNDKRCFEEIDRSLRDILES
ncbi:uncharacterized protein [Rutidosis leptorrhynchoides]|uniref:uncharacterized protein n=1 Tax=Rutidosis leptorrhynchoides TaxID=125765 RepID=UPI003A995E29